MCGICGFISRKNVGISTLIKMNNMLEHRGPDDHGEEILFTSDGWAVGLAQRRLAIMDLSSNGHQPMHSQDNRLSVIFNGEIYNFKEIKQETPDYPYKSECDTEVIIAAYLKWGINFVERLNGMFSIVIFDREDNSVYLIRDRMGKKPFYYFINEDGTIVFASELKAIMQHPEFRKEINTEVIGRYLHKLYIAGPDTIFKSTYKLEAGGILKFCRGRIQKWKYWDVAQSYCAWKQKPVIDYEQAKYELKNYLKEAVARRLAADVPVGAFLSGGYDSTIVCALIRQILDRPLKTFCIGFHNEKINEAHYSKKVAQYLGTEHYELYLDESGMARMIEDIPAYYDEPFADPSEIATMFLCEFAKKQVQVALTGDGGDELFGGYNIYTYLQQAQGFAARGRILQAIKRIPFVDKLRIWHRIPLYCRIASDNATADNRTQVGIPQYLRITDRLLLSKDNQYYFEFESKYHEERYDITRMLLDQETYLPEDILAKVDRASMKYALECRCPILDKDVVTYSYRILPEYKDDHGNQKKILKDIAYEMLPKELLERPKAGFGIPMEEWMQGMLKEQIMDWTSRDFLVRQGIFNPEATIKFVSGYLEKGDGGKGSGENYSQMCWAYFIFQQWYAAYMC